MKKAFTNTTIITGGEILSGVAILSSDGKIDGFAYDNDIPSGYDIHDLNGHTVAPALMDLQIYGGNGFLFSASPSIEAIEATRDYCRSGGAAKFLLTLATNAREVISKGILMAKQYLEGGGNGLLGLHIEGP